MMKLKRKLNKKPNKLIIIQLLEYFCIMCIALPIYLLPVKIALLIGEWLGEMMYRLMNHRRAIGQKNLTIAFGHDISDLEKERILRSTFRNFGKLFVEVLHFPRMGNNYICKKVSILGKDNYIEAQNSGKGVLVLAAHFGNWEMASYAQSMVDAPINIVARPLDNPFLNGVVTKLRTMHGNKLLSTKDGLKQIIKALKNRETVAILMDQNTVRDQGIFVNFFGEPACTIPVIAVLALRYDVPVIPAFLVRTGYDTHTMHIEPEISILRTREALKDIRLNTANFNKIIEKFIRKYPEQWFWIHNRWKTQCYSVHIKERASSVEGQYDR